MMGSGWQAFSVSTSMVGHCCGIYSNLPHHCILCVGPVGLTIQYGIQPFKKSMFCIAASAILPFPNRHIAKAVFLSLAF